MSDTNTTYEYCPYCDTEVELEATMGVQQCPNCGKALATCSLCAECIKPCLYEQAAEALNELQTLTTALDEALRRERIAVQELQKMRQRAETAEKKLQTYECSYCAHVKSKTIKTMTILHLPLKAKWYELIESGVKTEEYRECKPYWYKRLMRLVWNFADDTLCDIPMKFDAVKFSYGYTKRTMTFECKGITIGKGRKEWGAPDNDVFIIKLGKRIL